VLGWLYVAFGLLSLSGLLIIPLQNKLTDFFLNWVRTSESGKDLIVDEELIAAFLYWIHLTVAILIVVHIVFYVIAGCCFIKQKAYWFCFIMAVFTCLAVPFGTILGIVSIIVLNKPAARALFGPEPDASP